MRDERAYLFDMIDSARMAMAYVRGKTFEQFVSDTQLQDAVVRRLSVIGEAVRLVTPQTRAMLPQLPWDDISAMRNILVHEYFGIDMQVVWDTVSRDLQPLVDAVERILKSQP